jgi:hypothetical protein
MTGQVKEEIMTRWGELGIRFEAGQVRFDPVLLDQQEIPQGGYLRFTLCSIPFQVGRGQQLSVRCRIGESWHEQPHSRFSLHQVDAVEIELA